MVKMSLNELASEGERLCKLGDCLNGIKCFEEALKLYEKQKNDHAEATSETLNEKEQTKVLNTMSVIYNQMGNAYFNMQEYGKALECHRKDLFISEQFGDDSGKAKACGNVGNTLQLMGEYDEAIFYMLRNLEICKKLQDSTGEARALYNLANIYQAKGKFMGRLTYNDNPINEEFNGEIREVLNKSVFYYKETLKLVALKDRAAEGRTYGNLGNTYYFLGDFESAIECHNLRLKVSKEYGDKAAERRAYSNLGNAYIFQGKFTEATEYYAKAMNVARVLGDKAIEAQSYYSLGNAYILLQDYSVAIDFHLRHLQIAQLLEDKIGESRAYWSLGNAYAALGDFENAIMYANHHLNLVQSIGDKAAELEAKKTLYDYQNILSSTGYKDSESGLFTPVCSKYGNKYLEKNNTIHKSASVDSFYTNTSRETMSETVKQLKMLNGDTPMSCSQRKNLNSSLANCQTDAATDEKDERPQQEQQNDFFDVISKMQSNRLDDQRCTINALSNKTNTLNSNNNKITSNKNSFSKYSSLKSKDIFGFILRSQRSNSNSATDISNISKIKTVSSASDVVISASFSASDLNMPTTTTTSASITSTPTLNKSSLNSNNLKSIKNKNNQMNIKPNQQAVTVPSDDAFFNFVQKVQSRRLDEQRTSIKSSSIIPFKKPL